MCFPRSTSGLLPTTGTLTLKYTEKARQKFATSRKVLLETSSVSRLRFFQMRKLNNPAWNFPLDLSLGPLCEMLAAGNRVIIKPSEFTPATGALLAKMIAETYPEDLVTVVNGGLELSKRFAQLKFNHILYTGNPAVGKLVMGEAAKNLVPVTLELGGKCPAIMQKGSVNDENVETIVRTKMIKNGQMCISVDYVLCPRADVAAFTNAAEKLGNTKLSDYTSSADNTGIISERHLKPHQQTSERS